MVTVGEDTCFVSTIPETVTDGLNIPKSNNSGDEPGIGI